MRVLAIVAATTAPLCFSSAQQPAIALPRDARMHVQTWSTSSGLPQNTVTTLLQARDGTLWVGTFGGLCRFDGLHWHGSASISDPLDQRVTALCEDGDGTLWIGTQAPTLQRVRGGVAERIAVLPGPTATLVQRLRDGRVVVGTEANLFAVDEEGAASPCATVPLAGGRLVLRVPDGDEWLIARSGVHRLTGDNPERLWPVPSSSALVAADGTVYVGTNRGLVRWLGNTFEPVPGLPAAAPRRGVVTALAESRTGELWVAFEGFLCRFSPAGATPSLVLPVSHRIRALCTTSDGSLWVGFDSVGLARLRASEAVLAAQLGQDGAPIASTSVLPDGIGGWFVGTDHGLYRWHSGRFQRDERFGGRAIAAIHEVGDTVWFGTEGGLLALRDGVMAEHRAPSPVGRVRAIHADATGRLWCGGDGLWWFCDGRWCEPPEEIALPCETVKLIVPGHDGELWIATTKSLSCVTADLEQRLRLRVGIDLPHSEVRAVLPRDRGRVWLGTYGAGFLALDGGRRTVVSAAAGLHDRFVCSVLPLEQRWLVGSNRGTFLVDPDDLDLIADGERSELVCRPLLGAKGPAAEANGGVQPSIARAGSTVMLCAVSGLLEVDLASLQPATKAPPCRIERIVAGGRPAAVDGGTVHLGADRERVFTFHVTAPEFDLPELLRFRWRLLPGDGQWSAPSPARTVSFDVTGPGEYRFEVAAVGTDDGALAEPARLSIVVAPRAWERTSFQLGALALLALGVWLAVRFGGRRHARAAAHLARLVDERTAELQKLHGDLERRVADRTRELQQALHTIEADHAQRLELERELQTFQRMESLGALAGGIAHDFNNLLTVVLGNVQLIEAEHPRQPELLRLARRIRDTAEQGQQLTRHLLTAASREAATATVIDLGGCVRALRPLLEQFAGGGVRVDVDVPADAVPVLLSPVHLEQILSNLCANARDAMPCGGVVRIAVGVTDGRALLKVSDTGSGMTDEVKRRAFEPFFTTKHRSGGTGMGLATVYGITKQAGGTVTIDSVPGRGTTFVFSLPLGSFEGERTVQLPRPSPPEPAPRGIDTTNR